MFTVALRSIYTRLQGIDSSMLLRESSVENKLDDIELETTALQIVSGPFVLKYAFAVLS